MDSPIEFESFCYLLEYLRLTHNVKLPVLQPARGSKTTYGLHYHLERSSSRSIHGILMSIPP